MKNLVFIAHRVPYPPDKGERLRAFHQIKALANHFSVTVAAPVRDKADRQSAAELGQWCQKVIVARTGRARSLLRGALGVATGKSATEGYFSSRRLHKMLQAEASRQPFDIGVGYSSSTLPYLLATPCSARVMDLVDVDSEKWAAYAADARFPAGWLYRREARMVRRLETTALDRCDAVVLVSEAERKTLAPGHAKLHVVGNGVDTEYFTPAETHPDDDPSLVFTGTMDYRPNADGVCWFVERVWPSLKSQLPRLTFTIVGRNPGLAVRRLGKTPGVAVTGTVPDVRPYLTAAAVAICPLHIAKGVQNKVLEAMACGLPVVASSEALVGLEIEVPQDAIEAGSVEDWQRALMQLLTDRDHRRQLGRRARKCIEAKYDWEARLAPLVSLSKQLSGPTDEQGKHQNR